MVYKVIFSLISYIAVKSVPFQHFSFGGKKARSGLGDAMLCKKKKKKKKKKKERKKLPARDTKTSK